jgi:glycosyltransferase involved in cell wall biosynthesis
MTSAFGDHWEYYRSLIGDKLARRIRGVKHRIRTAYENNKVASLRPEGPPKGDVLLSYVLSPFLLRPDQPVPHWHSNYTESLLMAKTFLSMGYGVDVISYINDTFVPRKDYAVIVDSRYNMERLAPRLSADCVKIMHIDVAHLLFSNAAESRRLLELQQRKGVSLTQRRFQRVNLGIEHAHGATILGNEFTMNTFRYSGKPLYPVPIIPPVLFPWLERKDLEACRRRFLWFGSGGLVNKGLDLTLEAFLKMPEYHLTVCGPIDQEKDFERAYRKELYETENIRTVGWVDIKSAAFQEIAETCLGLVFPSCCEGQCGGVITCLHTGLIPIISYESGVDVEDFGVILRTSAIDEIMESVRRISGLPVSVLETMSRKAWEYARTNHTAARFADEYQKAIDKIMRSRGRIPDQPALPLPRPGLSG